jgi:preprotein translocase subunit SecD
MLHFPQWKVILVIGVVLAGIVFSLPNLFPRASMEDMPSWLPHRQVNLGLDLQGGAHLLYQLDEKEMVDDWLGTIRSDVRETLRRERIPYVDLNQNVAAETVSVKIREPSQYDKAYD